MNYHKRSADTAALLKGSKGVEVMTTSELTNDAVVTKTDDAGPRWSWCLLVETE